MFWISVVLFIAASYGAYLEQIDYDPVAEAQSEMVSLERDIQYMARDSMQEQARCWEETPENYCEKLTYEDYMRRWRPIVTEVSPLFNDARDTSTRNIYILIALISGWIVSSRLKKRIF